MITTMPVIAPATLEVVLVHKFGTIWGIRIVGTEKVKAGFTKKSDAEMWMKKLLEQRQL